MKKTFLSLLILLSPLLTYSQVTYNHQWLNLYRYTGSEGDFDSLVTNDTWFFHELGRTHPQLEIEKAIEVLGEDEKMRCLYPARTLYLKREGLLPATTQTCPKFAYFKRKVKLQNVWLVFASYFVNNPSSAFGHTLFKLEGAGNNNDLLEYGANFAAVQTTRNPFLYALYGLTGGFKGNFSLLPYFIKIQEYSGNDSRDLWEYKLNFNKEELEMFLAHLWEMDQAQFDYYYLTENCSYHLLLFMDAIRPSLRFKERLPYFVLPSETLRITANSPGLVSQIKTRPSQFKVVKERFKHLSKKAKEGLEKELNPTEKARLLDYQMDRMDLVKRIELLRKEPDAIKAKRKLQAERAKLFDIPPEPVKVASEDGPHLIHPSRYLELGYGFQRLKSSPREEDFKRILLTYRFSFHEYLDNQKGAPPWSELMLGKVELAYESERQRAEIKDFTLFKTEANEQETTSPFGLTWGLQAGARDQPTTRAYDLGPYAKPVIGINWQNEDMLIRFLTPLTFEYSRPALEDKDHFKGTLEAKVDGVFLLGSSYRIQLGAGLWWSTFREETLFRGTFAQQIDLSSVLSWRIRGHLLKKDWSTASTLVYYF